MPAQELPARPNLDQYKKRAKELVKAAKAGDARAFALMREHHPRLKKASDDELRRATFALADAQLIVARWHGFESWPKFAKHIETITSESSSRIWTRAEKALVDGDVATLDATLARHGDMLRKGPVQSSWWGGLAPNYAKGDARAIIAREHDFESWDQFAAFGEAMRDARSPIAQFEAAVDAIVDGDIATLERLLRANPSLVRARSTRKHHSTLLHYVGSNGVEGFRQRTPKNIVKVAEVLLDAGADINATADMYGGGSDTLGLAATSIHPVTAGVQDELMAFLLARGASVGGEKGPAAWSKLINGCHANGRPGAAEFLARRADGLDLEAAAGVGRLDIVETFFDANGRLTPNATDKQMKDGFTWACEYGRSDVAEFLLQRGMDAAAKLKHHGQTGMHWAAYRYQFRIRCAPIPVRLITFGVVALIGPLILLTDLWYAEHWLVLRGPVITPSEWEALLAAFFLLTIITWAWFAFVRPPTYKKTNAEHYARALYEAILQGSLDELPVIAGELRWSAFSLVRHASNQRDQRVRIGPGEFRDRGLFELRDLVSIRRVAMMRERRHGHRQQPKA